MESVVVVMHEYGAPSHYYALEELCKRRGIEVKYRVFSPKGIGRLFYKKRFKEGIDSILFMLSLPFMAPQKIILGIAPYNYLLRPLSYILKKHTVFYHTSYTCWDGTIMAHKTSSTSLIKFWKKYLNNRVKHIFAVSSKTKQELVKHDYADPNKISVVNHSLKEFPEIKPHKKNNDFIFVGRLVAAKGIEELLTIFKKRQNLNLTVIGTGDLEELVKEHSAKYPNIHYMGYIHGIKNIIPHYTAHSFFLMNSKRTDYWEELFGISIIEGMACGCVPIATNHTGPKEIITDNLNGFLCKEGEIANLIDKASIMPSEKYENMQLEAMKTANKYRAENIGKQWIKVIDYKN